MGRPLERVTRDVPARRFAGKSSKMERPIVPEDLRNGARAAALLSVTRAALTIARNSRGRAVRSAWPEDRGAELLLRAASSPASTATATALTQIAWQFVASLVPISAAAAVLARSLRLSFDGAAEIRVPGLALPSAQWTGEGGSIAVAQGLSAPGAVVTPSKLASLIALTHEMINHSNGEAMVRQVLLENVGPVLDLALFSASAGAPGIQPAGLLSGIAALTPSNAASMLDAMVADVAAVATAIAPAAGASQPMLVAAPGQAVALALYAPRDFFPVLMSAALPPGTVVGIVPAGIASVVEAPAIEASTDAVIHMANPGAPIVDIGGVLAAPVASMWQTDSAALRLTMLATWARRSPSAVAWIGGAKW